MKHDTCCLETTLTQQAICYPHSAIDPDPNLKCSYEEADSKICTSGSGDLAIMNHDLNCDLFSQF